MILRDNYEVDFRRYKSINCLLEFHSKLTHQDLTSLKRVNILTINSILVNIDIISGSYVNGSTQPTTYSIFPNVSPGYKIIENPQNLLYLPISSDTIHSITIWPTDQNGNEFNLREENLSMRFHLREIWQISWVKKIQITPVLKCEYQKVKRQAQESIWI